MAHGAALVDDSTFFACCEATSADPTSPAELLVSLNNRRTHTKNIYAKLRATIGAMPFRYVGVLGL
jgi:hypothetical protein